MSLVTKILAASGSAPVTYVDDVFSAYTYTATGATRTIINGIDLAGKGGMVWIKGRTNTESHAIFDTLRGTNKYLPSNNTTAQITAYTDLLTSFNSNGFTLGADASTVGLTNNGTTIKFASWTFRDAPKFFDTVTYAGNSISSTSIPHSLGTTPGMIIIKCTSTGVTSWAVWHRSTGDDKVLFLNSTGAVSSSLSFIRFANATVFSLGATGDVNASGQSYVAYLFAHDPSADGLIQCGSFTSTGVPINITLGWEPQFLMFKPSSGAGNWEIVDSARGFQVDRSGATVGLEANLISAEAALGLVGPTSTGFTFDNGGSGVTYIYMAIRRPNKPPTTGTQVYNAIARTGTGAAATVTGVGFAPDLVISNCRSTASGNLTEDRLRGATKGTVTSSTAAEITIADALTAMGMDGFSLGVDTGNYINANTRTYIHQCFKRAPGVFDMVCYTGTTAGLVVYHKLAAVPELIIIKSRSNPTHWWAHAPILGAGNMLRVNLTDAIVSNYLFTFIGANSFILSDGSLETNTNSYTYVAYLFATKAGISKVGSYTGNGTTQTIDCGFTTGARFVMIKRTNAAGDWYVWDTVRGIVSANDPHLSLNTTAAEVTTDDSIDPNATGFIVNQVAATNINVTSATYIYLAFA